VSAPNDSGVGQSVQMAAREPGWVDIPDSGPARLGTAAQRSVARIIDYGILSIAVLILARLHVYDQHFVHVAKVDGTKVKSIDLNRYGRVLLVQLGANFLYDMLFIAATGSTIGMKIMGIKVVRDTDGGRPTFASAALRALLLIVLGSLLCGFGFVIIGMSFLWDVTKRRQGWHDKTAATLVVVSR